MAAPAPASMARSRPTVSGTESGSVRRGSSKRTAKGSVNRNTTRARSEAASPMPQPAQEQEEERAGDGQADGIHVPVDAQLAVGVGEGVEEPGLEGAMSPGGQGEDGRMLRHRHVDPGVEVREVVAAVGDVARLVVDPHGRRGQQERERESPVPPEPGALNADHRTYPRARSDSASRSSICAGRASSRDSRRMSASHRPSICR